METFKKRQKEMKRLERQRDKAARRMQRKLAPAEGTPETTSDEDPNAPKESSPAVEPTTEPATDA